MVKLNYKKNLVIFVKLTFYLSLRASQMTIQCKNLINAIKKENMSRKQNFSKSSHAQRVFWLDFLERERKEGETS